MEQTINDLIQAMSKANKRTDNQVFLKANKGSVKISQ